MTMVLDVPEAPEEADGVVSTWELKAHRLQYFHAHGDDPAPVLEQIAEWIFATGLYDQLVGIDIRKEWSDLEERDYIAGTVEYVGEPEPTLRELQGDCWSVAESHGWHDGIGPHTFVEKLALIHSEVSEALEEHRDGRGLTEVYVVDGKPEGVPIELADAVIRILDLAEICGIDITSAVTLKQTYNRTRPFRHGGKTC